MPTLGFTFALLSVSCLLGSTNDSISDAMALAMVMASPLFMVAAMVCLDGIQLFRPKKASFGDNLRIIRNWRNWR